MLIPYDTDAPTYHFPFATIGIIVINYFMFLFTGTGDYIGYRWLILQYDTINPMQWITAMFMHVSWVHLIGNMIFLWCFGLVIEGKLGWRRFSCLYLAIAFFMGAIVQIPMCLLVGTPNGALGASGVIFGLIAIAMIWAPANDMNCLLFFVRPIDVPIVVFAVLEVVTEFIFLALADFKMSTPMGHLAGFVVAVPIGIYMLRAGLVDCEGWDLFSRLGLTSSASRDEELDAIALIHQDPAKFNPASPATQESFVTALQSFSAAIAGQRHEEASRIFDRIRRTWGIAAMDDATLARYANMLCKSKQHLRCIEPLGVLVQRRSQYANRACIRIALIQLRIQKDPAASIETIKRMVRPWNGQLEKERQRILNAARVAPG